MECNKEEAIRAKGIAENKMLNKDFIGARKIVVKAQKLFPDLENVSQMLTVCDVHCTAEVKINGEMDWYGILQVTQTADELTIKKQYRKLALLLHPDKNKFGGAEAAFKLVGEAHRTLTDQSERVVHDMKRGGTVKTVNSRQPPPKTNKTQPNGFTQQQPAPKTNKTQPNGFTQQQPAPKTNTTQPNVFTQQQSAPFSSNQNQTFWTICPSCGMKYEYYMSILNRALRCQNCKKPFIAYDLNSHNVPPSAAPTNFNRVSQQEKQFPAAYFAGQKSNLGTNSNMGSNINFNIKLKENAKGNNNGETINIVKLDKVKPEGMNRKEQMSKQNPSEENTETAGSKQRISSKRKQNISYNEEKSNDDLASPKHKRPKTEQTTEVAAATCEKDSKAKPNANSSVDFNSEVSPEPEPFSYPDPEFCDFDKERDEANFAVDQIWAIYDDLDAMPRYYALIRHVYGPSFKVRFTWLEYDPIGKAETLWVEGGLPIGCGSFKLGKSEYTQKRFMFSHLMQWRKGLKNNTFEIFPRKNEVWALFKNWDNERTCSADTDRHYEFEIVEVLADLTEGDVITVVRLIKIQGFVSLFVQAADKELSQLKVQMKDILQFSHRIPAHRLTGDEREGIPKGSLELDCASLPHNFAEMFSSISLESFKAGINDLGDICKEQVRAKENAHGQDVKAKDNDAVHDVKAKETADVQDSNSCYSYPNSEFYNFEADRSDDKFKEGQIWALYSDIDKNPNYYARIKKVESDSSNFKAFVNWLEACSEQEHEKYWFNENLPVGCGTFKSTRKSCMMDTTDTFSHIVHANPTAKRNHYVIYPCVGEIWAVHRNWNIGWSISDLEKGEFDLVEILDVYRSGFKVMGLAKENGHVAVFRGDSAKTTEISSTERLKFSHKIPAFRLTEGSGGNLRGCWELDPASVPELLMFANSS